jgi:hypothetical protein
VNIVVLFSALAGSDWTASRPDRFARLERAPSPYTHRIVGCVDTRAGLDGLEKTKVLISLSPTGARTSTSRPSSPFIFARQTTLSLHPILGLYHTVTIFEMACFFGSVPGAKNTALLCNWLVEAEVGGERHRRLWKPMVYPQ